MSPVVRTLLLCAALVAGAIAPRIAGAAAQKVQAVEVELVAERTAVAPGSSVRLGLRLRHDAGWHTYWRNPGDSGLPTQLALSLPAGWSAGPLQWPAPVRQPVGPLMNFGYDGEIVLPVTVDVPADATPGPATIRAHAQWLMCREVCIPGDADLQATLPVDRAGGAPSPWAARFAAMDARTPHDAVAMRGTLAAGTLSMYVPGASAAAAEFFPYRAGLVDNPAAQRWYDVDGGRRLDVPLVPDAQRDALQAGLFDEPAGVMVLDGRPVEVRLAAGDVPAGGRLAWTTPSAQSLGASTPSTRSRFGDLLGGLGSSAAGISAGGERGASGNAGANVAASPVAGSRGGDASVAGANVAGPGAAPLGFAALAVTLALGVLGGLVLNLMPCVFPVIGLKVLGFASHAGGDREALRQSRRHAAAFAAGVVISFWALAALLLALRAAGEAAGWGFQLQSPPFVAAMALLFVGIGLNLSGVFEIGASLTRLGGLDALASASAERAAPHTAASFASGVLAVLVATPCTAPFMGAALGVAASQPPLEAIAVYTAIGIGMALPYALLGSFPGWLRWLPRPGRWMQSLREALAFPMYGAAAWLAWVLGQQAGIDAVLSLAIAAVLLALGAWLLGRFVQSRARPSRAAAACAAGAAGIAVWLAWPAPLATAPSRAAAAHVDGWQPWSDAAVDAAVSQGRPVLVDFTAAWCVSCQVNKKLVLERSAVVDELQRRGVVRLRADWTQQDPAITSALARHGRSGVPLYLLYLPGERAPRVLPEILTSGIVLDALAAAPLAQAPR